MRILSFTIVLILIFTMLSCSENTYYIASLSEDGIIVSHESDEVRVDFLKTVPPVTEEEIKPAETVYSEFINVHDFGAVGDGVTDDTKAFQNAMKELSQNGTLYFPEGTYLLTEQLFIESDNVIIRGVGSSTRLIYRREQASSDKVEEVSLFGGRTGVTDVTIRDMYMEYQGYFYPNVGESYAGKINGMYFTEIHDLLVENVEITGFNSSGINLLGLRDAYTTEVIVKDCYLHHNRVAGVLYGYIDGLIITGSVMEYMGSKLDGGTGYGSAGTSGAGPRNIRILNNECNYNYRKGIDLHAGENVIIEGNTCKANRLYGIYTEGPRTNHIVIKNNFISDMDRDKLDIGAPYTWNTAISIGTATDTSYTFFDYQIIGNVIEDYGLGVGESYCIYCYSEMTKGNFTIKDNVMICNEIDNFIVFTPVNPKSNSDINFIIEGNHMYAKTLKNYGIYIGKYNTLTATNNTIKTERQSGGRIMYLSHNKNLSTTVVNFNNMVIGNIKRDPVVITNLASSKNIIFENNIFNGEIIDKK